MSGDRRTGMGKPGDGVDRREAITTMALGALAAYGLGSASWGRFERLLAQGQWRAGFFTEGEIATLRVLADMIIPQDERSGAAGEAGAVEYTDFVVGESGDTDQRAWRDGLAWLDQECQRRYRQPFAGASAVERGNLLNDIAWPARASAELQQGAEFFTRARDLTAAAFFSSRMGVQDLGYLGGVANPEWRGAPASALRELGVSYEAWDKKYSPGGGG